MADKIPTLGNFSIPDIVFDMHEWVADGFLDGEMGSTCTLIFPAKREECDNCIYDPHTGRSAHIYKAGGPIAFADHGTCPRCQGRGTLEMPSTDSIRLRTYWEASTWRDIGIKVADPEGRCVVIGYMTELPKLERADLVLLNDDLKNIRNFQVAREGEAQPWGFRRDRYFTQVMARTGGG
jgi:hypothetical protein